MFAVALIDADLVSCDLLLERAATLETVPVSGGEWRRGSGALDERRRGHL